MVLKTAVLPPQQEGEGEDREKRTRKIEVPNKEDIFYQCALETLSYNLSIIYESPIEDFKRKKGKAHGDRALSNDMFESFLVKNEESEAFWRTTQFITPLVSYGGVLPNKSGSEPYPSALTQCPHSHNICSFY